MRELLLLPFSVAAILRLRGERFDLLHVNEITLLPLGLLAKWLMRIPMVVHVRSLQRSPESGVRSWLLNRLLVKHADAVVAIDHTVRKTLEPDLQVHIVHNGLAIDNPLPRPERKYQAEVKIGFLGVLIALKGIYELIEAMRILKARGVSVHCLIAGENARQLGGAKAWILGKMGLARDVRADLDALIAEYGLQSHVSMLGFVDDVRTLYPQLDVLCFPSHLDAAGRPVFEAAFYSVPSVVSVENPVPDAIIHEVTGLAIPQPDPPLLADALQRLAEDAVFRQRLGEQARVWAEQNFAIDINARLMREIYQSLVPVDQESCYQ